MGVDIEKLNGVWLDHICAEGYNGKWTLHYLTDEEVLKCYEVLHKNERITHEKQ